MAQNAADEKDPNETKISLPWERGFSKLFPIPPKKIAANLNHSAAICNVAPDRGIFLKNVAAGASKKADADFYTWGKNTHNVCGVGQHMTEVVQPTKVAETYFLEDKTQTMPDAYEVACGAQHTMILMNGKDEAGRETGTVYGLGLGYHGRLGGEQPEGMDDDTWFTEEKAIKVKFEGAYKVVDKPSQQDRPCAKTDGVYFHDAPEREAKDRKSVLVWGSNIHGTPIKDKFRQEWLRVDSTNGSRFLPMVQDGLRLIKDVSVQILRIACGSDHTMCLATTGVLYAWGLNSDGQCGVDHEGDVLKPTPVAVPPNTEISHFACGARHSLLVNQYGALYSWGCSQQGRLGNGKTPNQLVPVKNMYSSDVSFSYVACGEAHSGAIDKQDRVYTWGAGAHGRLGHGETVDTPTPTTIEVLEDVRVKQLALGGFHSIALTGKPQKVYT